MRSPLVPALLFMALSLGGCGSQLKGVAPPLKTEAALGRVVIYRNGVAYFQRHASVYGNELKLSVPVERLDDFLKSLTVVEQKSGRAVPISFPTLSEGDDEVTIRLELPKDRRHELKITYVTESPSWKPSYRLELKRDRPARLEAWAVVHNVSGEDWKGIAVGVGSTSALSFKYDLRSVHLVDRETLSDETALGVAPPTGGSPYQVAGNEVELLGAVRLDSMNDDGKAGGDRRETRTARKTAAGVPMAEEQAAAPTAAMGAGSGRGAGVGLSALSDRARNSKKKIRVEGYAKPADADRMGASLANANAVRDKLVQSGVEPARIEVVATGRTSTGDAARVVALNSEEAVRPAQAVSQGDEPLGDAYFVAPAALDVEKGHSAMVNVLTTDAQAKTVYFYDPISARGSKHFAFRAVMVENPSQHTLDPGPVTVYSDGQFLGEGLSDAIPPKSRAFIPFSLDKKLVVETKEDGREDIDRLVTAQRGVLTTEARRVRVTELSLTNRGTTSETVYVRHALLAGYVLEAPSTGFERLRGAYLFPVVVPPSKSVTLRIEEATPIAKQVDIRTPGGVEQLKLYLKSARGLSPELSTRLAEVVEMHRGMAELEERIRTAGLQTMTYRERVTELEDQLVSLRKVRQADELSRNLAKKMDEISKRLQSLTIQMADFEGELLKKRVALEDRLAELTLSKDQRVAASTPRVP
jgi:hypothetical protein